MVLVFNRYNYVHFCVLRDDSQTYFSLLAKSIVFKITQDDATLGTKYSELAFNSLTAVKEDYVRLLNDAAGRARGQCMTFVFSFAPFSLRVIVLMSRDLISDWAFRECRSCEDTFGEVLFRLNDPLNTSLNTLFY